MRATRIGIPMPAHADAPRASGRYVVKAPDAPIGSILRVTTRDGDVRYVEIIIANGDRRFIGVESDQVDFSDWDYASRQEVDDFKFTRSVALWADQAELRGVPAFVSAISVFTDDERNYVLRAVADELKKRDKSGKAAQALAYLR